MADTTSEVKAKPTQEEIKEALELMQKGKEYHQQADFGEAIDAFSSIIDTITAEFGPKSIQVSEISYYYGDSLLQTFLAHLDAMEMAERGELDSSDDEEGEKEEEGKEGENEGEKDVAPGDVFSLLGSAMAKAREEVAKEEAEGKYDDENEEGGSDEDKEGAEDGDEDEDAGDDILELATKLLEQARDGLENEKDRQDLLSSVLLSLGQVCLETDNIDNGLEYYKKAADIREATAAPNDKSLFELYYVVGSSLGTILNCKYIAIENLEKAKKIVDVLKSDPDCPEDDKTEFETLLVDIDAKIEDLKAMPDLEDLNLDLPRGTLKRKQPEAPEGGQEEEQTAKRLKASPEKEKE